jgi:hypothetical protein
MYYDRNPVSAELIGQVLPDAETPEPSLTESLDTLVAASRVFRDEEPAHLIHVYLSEHLGKEAIRQVVAAATDLAAILRQDRQPEFGDYDPNDKSYSAFVARSITSVIYAKAQMPATTAPPMQFPLS